MKRISFLVFCIVNAFLAHSQEKEIKGVIDQMFQAMYSADTATLRSCFAPAAKLMTYTYGKKGDPVVNEESLNELLIAISQMPKVRLEERLLGWQCLIDDGMASVWTPYEFYAEDKFSHCGVNSFQLIKLTGKWKITQITDTRRRNECPDDQQTVMIIDSLINVWHHSAAIADEKTFFGMMAEDGIYIGTDATERWLRDELAEWSKKFFDRESAWDFKPRSRTVKIAEGGETAWFDELLETWMGTCRSTGILTKKDNEWKITHYQLSIAIPNDKVDSYLKLLEKQ